MTTKGDWFRIIIRVVFLGAYGAFLWASLHHVAFFYHSFEPDQADWSGSYWLAVSIDVTALVMTIGVMFFRRGMHPLSFFLVWVFIIGLSAFSWVVNWEYAVEFQNGNLARATDFQWINPILASCFAFLNLVYSLVSEFFNTKPQSAADLQAEIDRMNEVKTKQNELKELKKGSGLIAKITETAKELQQAKTEIFDAQNEPEKTPFSPPIEAPKTAVLEPVLHEAKEEEYPDQNEPIEVESKPQSGKDASRRTMTIEEVINATGLTERKVKNLIAKRTLKVTARNKNRVLMSSVDEWLKNRPNDTVETGKIITVKLTDFPIENHQNGQAEMQKNGAH